MRNIEITSFRGFPKTFANSLLRRSLVDRIEDMPAGLVLVSSMAGYGKSTLLSQLASRAQLAVVCILGDSDNDLHFFLNHLCSAFQQSMPHMKTMHTDHTYTILSHICRVAQENSVMFIFDNCQAVANEEVYRALQLLMSAAENGFKVIMGSRKIPGFAARFILEKRCQLLRRDDLALSEGEVGELLKLHLNVKNPGIAGSIHAFTGGWAAGVMFCLRGEKYFDEIPSIWENIVERGLLKKYFSFEVLPDIPPDVLRFAQRASIIDSLNADICGTILETVDSRECLDFLAENNIFLGKCPGEPGSFIWIDIFQRIMLDLLIPTEKTVIIEKNVEYYLKRKMYLEAIIFTLKYEKPDLISRVLLFCGSNLLGEGQFELLGRCARVLEKSGEKLDAFIYGILAQYYYVSGDYFKMEYNFNMADSMFGKENTFSIQRSLYRGLLRYETDPPKYLKIVNNALFYFGEYNLKLPYLLPREQKTLTKIRSSYPAAGEIHDKKPLKVKQFGTFKVIVAEDGYEIPWRTKKGSELLAYLIDLNGKPVERSHLFDVIWPNELPNNHVAMLHNMIYNIRKELSAYKLQKLIQYRNKGYSIDMSLVDCDGKNALRICSAISSKNIDTLLENEVALSKYWGEYLENISGMWVLERKEYFDKMFVTGSLLLGDFYYDNNIYEKALVFLQNAQKIDIFSERITEKILNCYSKLGKFDKLRSIYEEFSNMLDSELDIKPTADLQLAYQRSMHRKV